MLNLSNVVRQLQAQRKQVQSELSRLDAAISALRGSDTSNGSGTVRVASSRTRRTLSAAGRRAINLAQKARGQSELQMARQVQRSLSARCQQVLAGRLRPPKGHDGQHGKRSRKEQRKLLGAVILHDGPPRQISRGGLRCWWRRKFLLAWPRQQELKR
jgi:hypothetical protein